MKEIAPNVIMIPPKEETAQEKERKRNLRVAAYCRVSTDDEEQLSSYENQRDYYTDKIMNEPGWRWLMCSQMRERLGPRPVHARTSCG